MHVRRKECLHGWCAAWPGRFRAASGGGAFRVRRHAFRVRHAFLPYSFLPHSFLLPHCVGPMLAAGRQLVRVDALLGEDSPNRCIGR